MMTHFFVSGAGRVGLVALVVLALGAAGPVAGQGFSSIRTDYAMGRSPAAVVVADVSGDGRPDLITANAGGSVSVRLAVGAAGVFGSRTDYPTPRACTHVAVADVDADGRPDLVTADYNDNTVGVRLAAGSIGSFSATRTDYATAPAPVRVVVADVNIDGRPDLLTLNASQVSVCLATGPAGVFAPASGAYATGGNALDFDLADVNADGRPDLVTTDGSWGTVGVRLADAAAPGAFLATRTDYASGTFTIAVAVVDVNADGRPDLVTANYGGSNVSVRLADAAVPGIFAATQTDYFTPGSSRALTVTDVNGDGRPDLVTIHQSDNSVGVRLAGGQAGVFSPVRTDYPTGLGSYDVAVADVNGDGRPDLVTVHLNANTVGIRLNTGILTTAPALAATPAALWPNPTGGAGTVSIRLPAAPGPPATVALLDALGRVVRPARALAVAGGQATGTLLTAGLPPGFYLVRLTSGSGTVSQRLVVE